MTVSTNQELELRLEEAATCHRSRLWGLSYRMTGSASEADDIVQETFLRLFDSRPDTSRSLGPWLTRVTINLARDRLRRRQRSLEEYPGEWLPEPAPEAGTEAMGVQRLVVRESARLAFLAALEVLTPGQRAVLLLRDVCELSTRETAEALGLSESNVKTTLHRARKAVEDVRPVPLPESTDNTLRDVMSRLFAALMAGDLDRLCELLAEDVKATQDSGGAYVSARRTVVGPNNVARLHLGILQKHNAAKLQVEEVRVNGSLAWLFYHPSENHRIAPRSLVTLDVDEDGKISRILTVVAPEKLERLLGLLGR